ncbi:MAG: hypothetical protein CVT94_16560 [Bacteroidetes bacterium HGW-Bacteroidetes-11]|nr:MAG: hypothetical protein CVT94_16560 [Bacteroidetes bacterium HGW-Bacteroidetes-11]
MFGFTVRFFSTIFQKKAQKPHFLSRGCIYYNGGRMHSGVNWFKNECYVHINWLIKAKIMKYFSISLFCKVQIISI